MTPNIAYVYVENPHWRGFRLWLPLFLLWIPIILLSPIILLVVAALCVVGQVNVWDAIATFWEITCSLPGTEVHVRSEGNHVHVKIL